MSLETRSLDVFLESSTPGGSFIALPDGPVTVQGIRALLEGVDSAAPSVWDPIDMSRDGGKCWRSIRAHPGLAGANNVTGSFRMYLLEHRVGADLTADATELIVHRAGDLVCVAANRTFGGGILASSFRPCDSAVWTPTTYATDLAGDIGSTARGVSPGSDAIGEFRVIDTFGMSVWFEPILAGGSPASGVAMLVSRLV